VSGERAEAIATDMISEGRLRASIDQVDNMIHFTQGEVLLQWDDQVTSICTKVNGIIDDISKAGITLAT
jgi:COP9 signalosome complex subunit 4